MENFIKKQIPKGFYFTSQIDDYSILGSGTFNSKVPIFKLKNDLNEKDLLTETYEIIPLGYRGLVYYKRRGFDKKTRKQAWRGTSGFALFCLLIDKKQLVCTFGFLFLESKEICKLVQIANLIDGEHCFYFESHEGNLPSPIQLTSCIVTSDPKTRIIHWNNFQCQDKYFRLYLSSQKRTPFLTKIQHAALINFVRLFCVIEHTFDFFSFTASTEGVQQVMSNVSTIEVPCIEDWYQQYLNEMLVHEMSEVRVLAKKCLKNLEEYK